MRVLMWALVCALLVVFLCAIYDTRADCTLWGINSSVCKAYLRKQ